MAPAKVLVTVAQRATGRLEHRFERSSCRTVLVALFQPEATHRSPRPRFAQRLRDSDPELAS